MNDWQTLAALAIVALTLVAFAWRALRRGRAKSKSCGSGCDCRKP